MTKTTTAFVSGVVGAAGAYLLLEKALKGSKPQKVARIKLKNGPHDRCVSKTTEAGGGHPKIRLSPGQALKWVIDDQCGFGKSNDVVELRFLADSPFDEDRPSAAIKQGKIVATVDGDADLGAYKYEVWLVPDNGTTEYRMEDPEVEIVHFFAFRKLIGW